LHNNVLVAHAQSFHVLQTILGSYYAQSSNLGTFFINFWNQFPRQSIVCLIHMRILWVSSYQLEFKRQESQQIFNEAADEFFSFIWK